MQRLFAGLAFVFVALTQPVLAAPIALSGSFVASSFTSAPAAGSPPVDPINGSFTLSFDDAAVVGSGVEIFVSPLSTFSMTPIGGHSFTAADTLAQLVFFDGLLGSFLVGGAELGPNAIGQFTNDFMVGFANVGFEPPLPATSFTYTIESTEFFWETGNVQGSLESGVQAVPEPSTLLLLSGGSIAVFRRIRKR